MPSKTLKDYIGYQNGGMAQPSSTGVHNNIDNLILQAELDKLAQTGSMRVDRTPEYIGGVDPVVENVALSPILTLKSLGSVGRKLLEKTGLRNPVSHYTAGQGATNILKKGEIIGTGEFPGRKARNASAISVTRDPMFTSRPHGSIGTDIRFILDRDELVKKGFPMKPIAVNNYEKVINDGGNIFFKGKPKSNAWWRRQKDLWGKDVIEELTPHGLEIKPPKMNPRFEFEERVRGNIPTENIKLIDLLEFPMSEANLSQNVVNLINQLKKTDIPIIQSDKFSKKIKDIMELIEHNASIKQPYHKEFLKKEPNMMDYLKKIREFPTYKFDPFKR